MKKLFESEYDKIKGRPFFDTRARYGRPADTIIFWYAVSPTGRISKYWTTLRINAEKVTDKNEKKKYIQQYELPVLRRGYKWSEPFLYSGEV